MLTLVLFLSACSGKDKTVSVFISGDTIPLRYADNLTLVSYPDYTIATLRNPWDTLKTLHTYILVPASQPLPAHLPEGTIVRTPLRKSVHCSLMDKLGAAGCIGGVCDFKYIKLPVIQDGYRNGTVTDCGDGMNPDMEKIIDLHPDAILLSPFENSGGYGRVEKLNIPIIECADYMETSALGRAEWMKFYGLLFGKSSEAENMFGKTVGEYNRIKDLANATAERPSVLVDQRYGQVWNVPGGVSTIGRLIEDAGGRNPFSGFKKSGSVALAPEKVLAMAHDADVWFVRYNQPQEKPLSELSSDAPVNSRFAAFKSGNVYGCNTRFVDFYEETPFHPDRLLRDFALVLHPELKNPGDTLRYYHKMK